MYKLNNEKEFLKLIENFKKKYEKTGVDTDEIELAKPKKYPCLLLDSVNSVDGEYGYFLETLIFYFDEFEEVKI